MNMIRFTYVGKTRFARLLLGLGIIALAGCSLVPEVQPDPTRFYVLTASPTAQKSDETAATGARRVFMRSVIVPEFLRGRVMQVRITENEVKFVDEARWAEPLEAALNRVMREDLFQRPGLTLVARAGESHDYEVLVQLRRCEGVAGAGVARLAARIEIYSGDVESTLVAHDDFTTEVPGWDGKDYGQLAGKLSVAAATLSERIFTLLPEKTR